MKNDSVNTSRGLIVVSSISVIAVTIIYLILGFVFKRGFGPDDLSAFECFWILYLLIPIIVSAYHAYKTKRLSNFAFPILVVFVYISIGLFLGNDAWKYGWISFLLIPIYSIVAREIDIKIERKRVGTDDNL